MKPKHARLRFLLLSLIVMGAAVALMLRSFEDSMVFFYTPTQLEQKRKEPGFDGARDLRIGGLVEKKSIRNLPGGGVRFVITDLKTTLPVTYHGLLPSLFREGQGVVAQGALEKDGLHASSILAKHDERYMPKEVVDQLKKSGRWQEGDISGTSGSPSATHDSSNATMDGR